MPIRNPFILLSLLISLAGCQETNESLPFLGKHTHEAEDTVYYRIPDFTLLNQQGDTITRAALEGKVYVADFFFISCPTICPKMKQQLLRVYEAFQGTDDVMIVSHTIDPKRDTVAALNNYARKLGVSADQWYFLTGDFDTIYTLAKDYMVAAAEDEKAPGGFIHSGAFVLLDPDGHIRGYYDGTDPEAVDKLMHDMKMLLRE